MNWAYYYCSDRGPHDGRLGFLVLAGPCQFGTAWADLRLISFIALLPEYGKPCRAAIPRFAQLHCGGESQKFRAAAREIIGRIARKHPPKREITPPKTRNRHQKAKKTPTQNAKTRPDNFALMRAKINSPPRQKKSVPSSIQRSTKAGGDCRLAALKPCRGPGTPPALEFYLGAVVDLR